MGEADFNVIEIFGSIDGEGKRTGELTTFIRLAGCNLRCNYCDTCYAQEHDTGTVMTVTEILESINDIHYKNITLTGGEPLNRLWISDLISALCSKGYNVNIETNGSIPLYMAPRYKGMFYTMDYKCPSSDMESKMDMQNLEFLDEDDVLKFVVGTEADLDKVSDLLLHRNIRAQVYISPVFNKIEPKQIVEYMKDNAIIFSNAKIQVQLHKIIWDPEERGV